MGDLPGLHETEEGATKAIERHKILDAWERERDRFHNKYKQTRIHKALDALSNLSEKEFKDIKSLIKARAKVY